MKPGGFLRPRRLASAALLAMLCAGAPAGAHADVAQITGLTQSSVCQFTLLSLTLGIPAQAAPNTSVGLAGTTLTISGSGTCTGAGGAIPFGLTGSGNTLGSPTCASISGLGTGSITVGNTYPIAYTVSGPAAGAQLVMLPSQALQGGGAGVAQLSITPASLQACLQPGGTTSLQYTGTALVAL
jgi:hypothetical protein